MMQIQIWISNNLPNYHKDDYNNDIKKTYTLDSAILGIYSNYDIYLTNFQDTNQLDSLT